MRRRLGLTALAVAMTIIAAGCGSDGSSNPSTDDKNYTIKVVDQGAFSNFSIQAAEDLGFMKAEGVTIETVKITTGAAEVIAALNSGTADVVVQTPLTLWNAINNGAKLKFFMGLGNADTDVVVASSKNVPGADQGGWQQTVQAMKGMKVGVSVRGSTTGAVAEAMFKQAGLDTTKDMSIVVTGPGAQSLAALKSGQVDAIVADTLASQQATSQGIGKLAISLGRGDGPPGFSTWMQVGAIARAQDLTDNPAKYAAFARAVQKASAYINDPANVAKVSEVVMKHYSLDQTLATNIARDRVKVYDPTAKPEKINATMKFFSELGLYQGAQPTYDDLVYKLPNLTGIYD